MRRPSIWSPVPYRGARKGIVAMQARKRARQVADRKVAITKLHRDYFKRVYARQPGDWPIDACIGIDHMQIVRSLNDRSVDT